ncbi:MAG: pyridoxal phosphate-dependent aminotransferase [Candidatus Nanohaloarchaea archaeon]|nr:pyridoxal phosphate-dependent aminotransferase [Candidatus Nanohaloarchaea archaeon]
MQPLRDDVTQAQYSVREISEQAAAQDDVVRFDIGQPDFDTPRKAKKAAQKAISEEHITYTALWGIEELRKEVASFESHKAAYTEEQVMVTTGGIGALYCLFTSLAEPGDSIVFNDPCWSVYPMLSKCSTAEMRQVPYFKQGEVNTSGIRDTIDDDTVAIVINNPENPTGRVYSRDELEQIIDIAAEHDCWVIGDEVYDRLTYGSDHVSVAEIAPDRSFVINSMSKNFAMTGWRIGWLLSPDIDILKHIGKLNRSTTACPNFVGQQAALAALQKAGNYPESMRESYQERKQAIEDHLDRIGLDYVDPEGAIYIFPDIGEDSWSFARDLLDEAGVAVVPGAPSGSDSQDNIRICFGSVAKEGIEEGMERLADFIDTR